MRLRTAYFKVGDMAQAVVFWSTLLEQQPTRRSEHWSEFALGDVRIGFLLNDFGEQIVGQGCVPVFELDATEIGALIERAKRLGATVVVDGLADPQMNGIVLAAPGGQEFELHRRDP